MRVAYFDCFSGASGDMILGALLDSGLDLEHLRRELSKLNLSHYGLCKEEILKGGVRGTRAVVEIDSQHHGRKHRHLEQIVGIIEQSELSAAIKKKSVEIFTRLAEAEALVHNQPVDHVHFHEVGAVDAIIDIVGAVVGLDALKIGKVYCSPLNVGMGTVECEHGILPVPAPAAAEIIKGVPLYSTGVPGELLTPTGAAILRSVSSGFGPILPMVVDRIGYGAGMRESAALNMLRVFIGEIVEQGSTFISEQIVVMETTIDDMSPQVYEHVTQGLRDLGACEVFLTPVQMKKNRPGTLLTLICSPALIRTCANFLVRETTSIGVRWRLENMLRLPAEVKEIQTEYGPIRYKIARIGEKDVNVAPEYEDCKRIALDRAIPLKDVIDMARKNVPPRDGHRTQF